MLPAALLAAALALPAAVVEAREDVRILVVDLQAKGGAAPDEAEILTGLVTARLQRYPKVSVLSGADIREMIALEAEKQAAGCDDASCLSEVAGALGAELIVTGQLGRLGSRYVVTLNLIDVVNANAIARETAEMGALSDAPAAVRAAVDELVAPMSKRVGAPDDEVSFFEAADATLTWTGWSLAGVGAATFLVEYLGFLALYYGAAASPIDSAFLPVCGPFCVFLTEGVNPSPRYSDEIFISGFCCSLCQLASCGLCLAAPVVLGSGALVGLFDEDVDEAAAALFAPPPAAPPLDDADRERLATSMPY